MTISVSPVKHFAGITETVVQDARANLDETPRIPYHPWYCVLSRRVGNGKESAMTATERLARRIKTIARDRDVTLIELSRGLGFKNEQNLYTRFRSGRWSAEELERAAELLGVEEAAFFADRFQLSSYLRLAAA